MREKKSLGYGEFDSFYMLRGAPFFDGNTGAGSENVGYLTLSRTFYPSPNPSPNPNPHPYPHP